MMRQMTLACCTALACSVQPQGFVIVSVQPLQAESSLSTGTRYDLSACNDFRLTVMTCHECVRSLVSYGVSMS